ncbi:hypothetical protein Ahy_A03g012428 [Arachis hypogaea]|uniref:Uncharacterized protein n=1 Tax=Arachis hypogaea TaxID=3818 RepID=A0A445DTD7_ARAHY|nr:hypothetical protein Ahy_A03g012428 [Arachis hypogaea]
MAIENHEDGEFLQPTIKKLFNIEDYKMFILFLNLKNLASHPYETMIMKWLEIIEPQNIKKGKYKWENWTQIIVFKSGGGPL